MNGLIDDITADGWMALCISILRGLPPDEAFRLLDDPTRRNLQWTPELLAEVEEMRKSGMSWNDIAKVYQVHKASVCKSYLRYRGKVRRPYQRHSQEFYLKIDSMRKRGLTWATISEEMGRSKSTLCMLYNQWKKKQERQNDK